MTATIEATTFQPGDIVRVREGDTSLKPGTTARVVGRNRHYLEDLIDVEWIDAYDATGGGWLECRFELVPAPEPEPFDATGYVVVDREPKVGDRVVSHYTTRKETTWTERDEENYDGPGVIERQVGGFWAVALDDVKHELSELLLKRHEFDILEKVKPQIGDVVKHDAGTVYLPAGATGDVTHVWSDGMVHVKWHDRSKQWSDGGFWSSGLTVVKRPEPELEPLFQVGDEVAVHYGNLTNLWLGVGEVIEVRDTYGDGLGFGDYMVRVNGHEGAFAETDIGYPEEPAPDVEPEFVFTPSPDGWPQARDSGIFGTVEDEAGLRALGKGAVIVSSVNGAEYVRISDNHYRTALVDNTGAFGFGYNYASTVFGAVRNGLTFLVLHPGI